MLCFLVGGFKFLLGFFLSSVWWSFNYWRVTRHEESSSLRTNFQIFKTWRLTRHQPCQSINAIKATPGLQLLTSQPEGVSCGRSRRSSAIRSPDWPGNQQSCFGAQNLFINVSDIGISLTLGTGDLSFGRPISVVGCCRIPGCRFPQFAWTNGHHQHELLMHS